jgi:general secretion pathway protein G
MKLRSSHCFSLSTRGPAAGFSASILARRARSQGGYTLLEIMLVVGIIIILLGGAVFYMAGNLEVGKAARADADIKMISTQLKTYEMTMLRPPSQADGLNALVTRPSSGPNVNRWRQLMKDLPLDPWGNSYAYRYPATKSGDPYDLYSWGPDREEGTADDIGNWVVPNK